MLKPLGDQAKVEVQVGNDWGDIPSGIAGSGILVEMPEKMLYLGYHSFAFENSLCDQTILDKVYTEYESLVGKRVYWDALSERGRYFKYGDKAFAIIKLTDIIAYSESDESWDNVSVKRDGSFSLGD